jgi:hypothetical protein
MDLGRDKFSIQLIYRSRERCLPPKSRMARTVVARILRLESLRCRPAEVDVERTLRIELDVALEAEKRTRNTPVLTAD